MIVIWMIMMVVMMMTMIMMIVMPVALEFLIFFIIRIALLLASCFASVSWVNSDELAELSDLTSFASKLLRAPPDEKDSDEE